VSAITLTTVKTLAPGEAIWDDAVRGFGVRRQKKAASYIIKYRAAGGTQRLYTIGAHGRWTPDTARKEARRLLGLVASGADPASQKADARREANNTLRGVIDSYLRVVQQKPRTLADTRRYLLDEWKPLHSHPIASIRRRDISLRVAEIAESRPVIAIRARAALSAMFSWAIREGYDIPANPVLGTNCPPEPASRTRALADAELRSIWRACTDDDFGRIVRLLILTGQRRDEIGGLRWSEIEPAGLRLPATRTKNAREHSLPLVPAARALLPPRRDGDFIFGAGPRRRGDPPRGYSGWTKSRQALDARIASVGARPLEPWVIHDIRRSVATGLAELGVHPHIIEAILNHVSGHRAGVAGVYQRARYSDQMQSALARWADHIAALVTGE
jgi:integrase